VPLYHSPPPAQPGITPPQPTPYYPNLMPPAHHSRKPSVRNFNNTT